MSFFVHAAYQMGENVFQSSEMLPWTDVVTAWHNEVANYNYPTGSANGNSIGHYTQVIWFRNTTINAALCTVKNSLVILQ